MDSDDLSEFLHLFHDLLSCSYLQHCVWSVITELVCSDTLRTSAQRATVEHEQLLGQERHENCDIHTLSMI